MADSRVKLSGIFSTPEKRSALLQIGSDTVLVKSGQRISSDSRVIAIDDDHILIESISSGAIRVVLLSGAETDQTARVLQLLQRGRMLLQMRQNVTLLQNHCKQLRRAAIKLELFSRYGHLIDLYFRVLRWELRQQEWLLSTGSTRKISQKELLAHLAARLPLAYELVKLDELNHEIGDQVSEAILFELNLIGKLSLSKYSPPDLHKAAEIIRKMKILAEWLEERAVHDAQFH